MKSNIIIKTPDELEKFYRSIIYMLQLEAEYCGYGLGVHGSLRRDLDLIAVPWVAKPKTKEFLAQRLMKKASNMGYTFSKNHIKKNWVKKPYGRVAISLPLINVDVNTFSAGNAYLDLSVKM